MAYQVIDMRCPGCGNPVSTDTKMCNYCYRPIVISTFNSVYTMSLQEVNSYARTYNDALSHHPNNTELNNSIALCYLKLGLYDKAQAAFEKAIEADFNNSETYFYAAVCLLKGKKAFLAKRADINKIEEYLNAAIMLEPKGIYYYFWAFIKYDFFERKYLNTSPNYKEYMQMSYEAGISDADKEMLFSILNVANPF